MQEHFLEFARKEGYSRTLMGRRRYIPAINGRGLHRRMAEGAAVNTPIQGSAAEIIKLAMSGWLVTGHKLRSKSECSSSATSRFSSATSNCGLTSYLSQVNDRSSIQAPGNRDTAALSGDDGPRTVTSHAWVRGCGLINHSYFGSFHRWAPPDAQLLVLSQALSAVIVSLSPHFS